MKNKIIIMGFICTFLLMFVEITYADSTSTVYDKNYNVKSHKKESKDKVTMYDKHWNRTGYESNNKIYDKNHNVQGYKKKESDGAVTIYDKNWNRIGHEKGDTLYNEDWSIKGHKKTDGNNSYGNEKMKRGE